MEMEKSCWPVSFGDHRYLYLVYERDGATAEWIALRVFFVAYPIGLRRLAKRLDLDESIAKIMVYCAFLLGLICHGIYNIFTAWPSPLSAYPQRRPAQRGDGVYGCLFRPSSFARRLRP